MYPKEFLGKSTWADGKKTNTDVTFGKLRSTIGGRPAAVLGMNVDVTATVSCIAAGAGITGRRIFDVMKKVTITVDGVVRHNGISGGHYRVAQLMMTGKEPTLPADIAIAAGAVTKQFRFFIPFGNYGGLDKSQGGVLADWLRQKATIALEWAGVNDLGTAAKDTITSATAIFTPVYAAFEKGRAGVAVQGMDINQYGNGSQNMDFIIGPARNAYAAVVPDNSGTMLAAGVITQLTQTINGDAIETDVSARAHVDEFNRDRNVESVSTLFAPDDAAVGRTDFFPLQWPAADEAYEDVPYGITRVKFTGTQTAVNLLTIYRNEVDDSKAVEVLSLVDPANAAEIAKTAAEHRQPITDGIYEGGHLTLPQRVRNLSDRIFHYATGDTAVRVK